MSSPVSSLLVGDRLVSRCDDGLLEAEYALFDRSEILLSPGVREEGYMTRAGLARARLSEGHVTPELALEAFAAMRGRHLRHLARSSAVREIIDHLGPYEAFQGGRFVAARGRYAGVWLDLDALAAACPLRDASVLFQALHLLLVLEDVAEDTPVRLLTSQTGTEPALGGRTWRRVDLEPAQRLPWVLRDMQAPTRVHGTAHDEAEVREEILRDLRARATAAVAPSPRLGTLAAAIARTGSTPPPAPGPPSRPPAPPAVPVSAALRQTPALEPATVEVPRDAIDFHTALRQRHVRDAAQGLADQVEQAPFAPDRAILAARAWMDAGEPGFARHLARLVVDDPSAADDVRIQGLEILDSTPNVAERPPPAQAIPPAYVAAPQPMQTSLVVRTARTPVPGVPPYEDRGVLDPRLVLLLEPDSRRSASFRVLRDHILAKKAPRIIAVSSGAVHEGKTTCAVNLALALSEMPSTRVLLMEGNFFSPSLAGIFHIAGAMRLDARINHPQLAPYRIAQMMRGLFVAALVQQAGEPAPTFNSRWFELAIERLSGSDYDHVVIDTAALDGSPAVAQLLRVADGTVLTARSRSTTARGLRRAAEQIPDGRALGVTLMDGDS